LGTKETEKAKVPESGGMRGKKMQVKVELLPQRRPQRAVGHDWEGANTGLCA
jgi:ribosomal protein S28E/S33